MRIINFFEINDWDIRSFLIVILSFHLAMWGTIGFRLLGIDIPMLAHILPFLYVSLIPGIQIVRILKLHDIGSIPTILLSVGFSLVVLMGLGLVMNLIYPTVGLLRPISFDSLIMPILMISLFLSILCYIFDRSYSKSKFFELSFSQILVFGLTIIFPVLAVVGTILLNTYQSNIVLILLIVSIAFTIILTGFSGRKISIYYPLLLYSFSLSLLLFTSLVSNYLWGNDIFVEYHYAKTVYDQGLWDFSLDSNVNSILSIVMLAPIFSIWCDLDLIWVFKIFYPLIYALVPLGLFYIFQEQFNPKIALYSSILFITSFSFYTEMIVMARQQVGEMFFILILIAMFGLKSSIKKRVALIVCFSAALIVSHYGLSYIYLYYTLSVFILIKTVPLLLKMLRQSALPKKVTDDILCPEILKDRVQQSQSTVYIVLLVTMMVSWYSFIASSSSFISVVNILDLIRRTFVSDFLSPETAQGLTILATEYLPLQTVTKMFYLFIQACIILGILLIISKRTPYNLKLEQLLLSVSALSLLVTALTVPFFAQQLQTSRFIHISQLILAPFCIIGFIAIVNYIGTLANRAPALLKGIHQRLNIKNPYRVLSMFLSVFLLFNSGLVYYLAEEPAKTASLISFDPNINYFKYDDLEIVSARWLEAHSDDKLPIYADDYRKYLLQSMSSGSAFSLSKVDPSQDSRGYFYLGTWNNVKNEIILEKIYYGTVQHISSNVEPYIFENHKIYSNYNAGVYYH